MQTGFKPIISTNTVPIDPDQFRKMVSELAYLKAEKRGFIAGHEMEDWLAAESEVRNKCFYWFQEIE